MLDILELVESELPRLLDDPLAWTGMYVDYHPPFVERLRRDWKDGYRVFLHRIHPCAPDVALFHPHPWPSAMRILSGSYEMAIGYGSGDVLPPIASRLILAEGSAYDMTDPYNWHAVRPLREASMSLMVTGQPWGRPSPKSPHPLRELTPEERDRLFTFFKKRYSVR